MRQCYKQTAPGQTSMQQTSTARVCYISLLSGKGKSENETKVKNGGWDGREGRKGLKKREPRSFNKIQKIAEPGALSAPRLAPVSRFKDSFGQSKQRPSKIRTRRNPSSTVCKSLIAPHPRLDAEREGGRENEREKDTAVKLLARSLFSKLE